MRSVPLIQLKRAKELEAGLNREAKVQSINDDCKIPILNEIRCGTLSQLYKIKEKHDIPIKQNTNVDKDEPFYEKVVLE